MSVGKTVVGISSVEIDPSVSSVEVVNSIAVVAVAFATTKEDSSVSSVEVDNSVAVDVVAFASASIPFLKRICANVYAHLGLISNEAM